MNDHLFPPGVSPNPGGKPKQKPLADALRYIATQPDLAPPPKPTNLQKAAIELWRLFLEDGDMAAWREIADRTEGKVAQPLTGGDDNDNPIEFKNVGLPEIARVLASAMMLEDRKKPKE